MKILYAIQATGNGHIARAQEIIPILKQYGEVDILLSGHQSQISFEHKITFRLNGVSLIYNKTGGISRAKTLVKNSYFTFLKDIFSVPIQDYDLVLNDFEPVTAWAGILRRKKVLQMSHQAALLFLETPKPQKKDWLGYFVLKYYAPAKSKIGFHFQSYHRDILLPVIRSKIRNLKPKNLGDYLVYLPSFHDKLIIKHLQKFNVNWNVFSIHAKSIQKEKNITIYPIDEENFISKLETCKGVLCNAGFELPSESIYLKKKLFVIPIQGQLEQKYNAEALKKLGYTTADKLDQEKISYWIKYDVIITQNFKYDLEKSLQKFIAKK